jgi:hypothetical protein
MLSALGLVVLFAAAIICVFLPYYWVARILQNKFGLRSYFLPLISLATSGLVAYIGLFTYYLSPHFIAGFQVLTVFSMLISIFILFKQRPKHIGNVSLDFSLPIILIFLITSLYGTISLSCSIGSGNGFYDYCYMPYATEDHRIPYQYAHNISNGNPTKIEGDWKSTDRPPLQAALYLADTYPLQWLTKDSTTTYQVLSMVMQASWVFALWVLLRIVGGSISLALVGVAASAFTSFMFANTFFVWPKLLAASFFVTAFALMIYDARERKKKINFGHAAIAGTFLGLAFLSHSGISFSLIALFIYLLIKLKDYNPKYLLTILLVFLAILLPWTIYSKTVDRSNDRLLKWHFAGQIKPNNDSLETALGKAYTNISLEEYLDTKRDNVEMIVYGKSKPDPSIDRNKTLALPFNKMVNVFMLTPGLLIGGWFGLILYRNRLSGQAKKAIAPLFFQLFVGLSVWLFLMYLPFSTIQHQGSYGLNLVMFALLAVGLLLLNRIVVLAVIAAQAILFIKLWTIEPAFYKKTPVLDYGMLSMSVILLVIILAAVFYCLHKKDLGIKITPKN